MVPESSAIQLTTRLFASEMPQLYAKYPDFNMSISFTQIGGAPPSSVSGESGSVWSSQAGMLFSVHVPDQAAAVPVVELLVNWQLSDNLSLRQNPDGSVSLYGALSPISLNSAVAWSSLDAGTLSPSIAALLAGVVNQMVVPSVNQQLAQGIPFLPPQTTSGMHCVNMYSVYRAGSWVVGMDVALSSAMAEQAALTLRQAVDQHVKDAFLAQQDEEEAMEADNDDIFV